MAVFHLFPSDRMRDGVALVLLDGEVGEVLSEFGVTECCCVFFFL